MLLLTKKPPLPPPPASPSSSSNGSSALDSPPFDVVPPGQGGHQSGVSTPMSSPPPREDFHLILAQWIEAQSAQYQAAFNAWRQAIFRQAQKVFAIYAFILLLGIVYLAWQWESPYTDWVVDTTSDLHVTNDISHICRRPYCYYGSRFIPINDPANGNPPHLESPDHLPPYQVEPAAGSKRLLRFLGRLSLLSSASPDHRPPDCPLRHNGLPVHGLGHAHLIICSDGAYSAESWWHPYLCKNITSLPLSAMLYVPTAPVKSLSLPLLAADEGPTLPLKALHTKKGSGEMVLSGRAYW